jgi:hypothetical protein
MLLIASRTTFPSASRTVSLKSLAIEKNLSYLVLVELGRTRRKSGRKRMGRSLHGS